MNKKSLFVLVSILVLMLSACTTYEYKPYEETPTGEVVSEPEISEEISEEPLEEEVSEEEPLEEELEEEELPEEEEEEVEEEFPEEELEEVVEEVEEISEEIEELPEEELLEGEADVVAFEGDLIDLKPYVMDPDGDPITLGYTSPFDENGMWQTEAGDAGFYSVIVTATDGKDSFVTKQMTVNVLVRNKPPVFGIADTLEFNEGDFIEIDPEIADEDGDDVVVTYSGWMSSRTYQTTFEDAGEYQVTIKADDGVVRVSKDISILVYDVNREPSLTLLTEPRIEVTEGDLVLLEVETSDPDGDELSVSFSEPLDENGEWQTEAGDAGSYEIEIMVSDGVNEVTQEVLVEVLKRNTAPEIEFIGVSPEYVELKKPGDEVTISLNVVASDADDDELTITYSGFMEESEMTILYGTPGGVKTVTVTVSDGTDTVVEDVKFEINNWPCFECQ